jgi:hypothetical protein
LQEFIVKKSIAGYSCCSCDIVSALFVVIIEILTLVVRG